MNFDLCSAQNPVRVGGTGSRCKYFPSALFIPTSIGLVKIKAAGTLDAECDIRVALYAFTGLLKYCTYDCEYTEIVSTKMSPSSETQSWELEAILENRPSPLFVIGVTFGTSDASNKASLTVLTEEGRL